MCLQTSNIVDWKRWNWAGDEILHNPVIQAGRKVPGTTLLYPIDTREYLTTRDNAVVAQTLRDLVTKMSPGDAARFQSSKPGTFDFRAAKILELISSLSYMPTGRKFDTWMFPDETLRLQGGDCEDLAFLLAALLGASGISDYCIRVALGKVHISHSGGQESTDHAWVMYQGENGQWHLWEPLALISHKSPEQHDVALERISAPSVSYIPYFVFNSNHLWRINHAESRRFEKLEDYINGRNFWKGFHPSFAMSVHDTIYDKALPDLSFFERLRLKAISLEVDVALWSYDPRDHFDFAYIDESWDVVEERLATGDFDDFALAVHTIGDFYAHTEYGDVGPVVGGALAPYDRAKMTFAPKHDFSTYSLAQGCDQAETERYWDGKLISGSWLHWYAPIPESLKNRPDFKYRGCLPDHDLFAVDQDKYPGPGKHRYTEAEFEAQFKLRVQAAITHIGNTYTSWRAKNPR